MRKVLSQASSHKAKAQYKSAVWTENAEQEAIAKKVAKEMRKDGVPVLPIAETKWNDAEEYHQKYVAKQRGRFMGCPR